MILVSVGTPTQPFDRLLNLVQATLSPSEAERTVWQGGVSSFLPARGRRCAVLPPAEFQRLLREAEAFISHAGEGSVMEALKAGKIPIVCPRRKAYGEHVNDHQLELADEMGRRGLALVASTVEEMRISVDRVLGGLKPDPDGWDLPRIQPVIVEILSSCEQLSRRRSKH